LQAVLVLQAAERALHGSASSVEVAPALRLARNQRVEARRLAPNRSGSALTRRAAPLRLAALHVGTRERPGAVLAGRRLVLALDHGRGLAERDDGQDARALAGFIDRPQPRASNPHAQ